MYSWFDLLFFKGCNDTIRRRKHTTYTVRTSTLSIVVARLILQRVRGNNMCRCAHLIYYHKCAMCDVCLVVLSFYVVYFILEGFNVYEVISNTIVRWPTNTDSPDNRHETSQGLMFFLDFHNNIATAENMLNTSSLILNIIEKVDSTLAGVSISPYI